MSEIVVRRGAPLRGEVGVAGAKNSALKLMAATLLAPGRSTLHNVPRISDVEVMADLLRAFGATVDLDGRTAHVDVPEEICDADADELFEAIRASTALIGPLLGRCGRARVAMPGGDDFGGRPINWHLDALTRLGVTFEGGGGFVEGRADHLVGDDILLEYPSVGATENVMMAAVLAKGRTTLDNAAREPEISDLAAMLNRMGAQVLGAGSSTIEIEGVDRLSPVEHTVVPDRIEATTYLCALAAAGGEITISGARADHMEMLIRKLTEMGMRISPTSDGLWAAAPDRMRAVDIATLPYPGVATDYKPLLLAVLASAEGVGIISENVFGPGRFRYVTELHRMGADVRTEGHHAVVRGTDELRGAVVRAHDIRAGAALVVAALAADGDTVICDADHIDRGYEDLVASLTALGADIVRAPHGQSGHAGP